MSNHLWVLNIVLRLQRCYFKDNPIPDILSPSLGSYDGAQISQTKEESERSDGVRQPSASAF